MSTESQHQYGDYVKMMYEEGFYVEQHNINLTNCDALCDYNKIVMVPISLDSEDTVYVLTGILQKAKTLSESTEFRLSLFDAKGNEFKDDDNIMLSIVKIDNAEEKTYNLYTRSYASWKFGLKIEKGIELNSEKYLIFQTQKELGKFDIDITNVDLFRRKNKIENKTRRMMWLD